MSTRGSLSYREWRGLSWHVYHETWDNTFRLEFESSVLSVNVRVPYMLARVLAF